MIRRPPRSTLDRSSAASDVYKRQTYIKDYLPGIKSVLYGLLKEKKAGDRVDVAAGDLTLKAVSYTHLRAHETVLDLVCRLLLEKKTHNKKKKKKKPIQYGLKSVHIITHHDLHIDPLHEYHIHRTTTSISLSYINQLTRAL